MFYRQWMSYLPDSARLTQVVIPGSHNAGSYGMKPIACCQDGNLYEQCISGVRHFCLRLDTTHRGIVLSHGLVKGDRFENALRDLKKALQACPTEFFIFDLREYYPQKIGPITLRFKADPAKVDAMLEQYIAPSRYAYCNFRHIKDVTIGDLRKSGKRYILINNSRTYTYSVNCPNILPWDKTIYGFRADKFLREIPKIFDREHTEGIYWFQTQQTPNIGTEVGFVTPRKLNAYITAHFKELMKDIAANPEHLRQANVIGGDFMTDDIKCREIIRLNLNKRLIPRKYQKFFVEGLKESTV